MSLAREKLVCLLFIWNRAQPNKKLNLPKNVRSINYYARVQVCWRAVEVMPFLDRLTNAGHALICSLEHILQNLGSLFLLISALAEKFISEGCCSVLRRSECMSGLQRMHYHIGSFPATVIQVVTTRRCYHSISFMILPIGIWYKFWQHPFWCEPRVSWCFFNKY